MSISIEQPAVVSSHSGASYELPEANTVYQGSSQKTENKAR